MIFLVEDFGEAIGLFTILGHSSGGKIGPGDEILSIS